jgi:hypothetical protein
MINSFDELFDDARAAISRAMNPEPTDAAVYEKDGKLYIRFVYGDTSGGDINIVLPKKDLTSISKGIMDYLLK